MAKYGLPYMGSKDKIADQIIKIFPKAKNFYDVFGGGFSVTHAMLENRFLDYEQFHFNEIRPGICELIQDAIKGKYNYDLFKPKWISRKEFMEKKDSDPYIKICWSFGNNGKGYMFGEIEPYKKSMHQAIIFNEFDDLAKGVLGMEKFRESYSIKKRRLFLRNRIEYFRLNKNYPEILMPFIKLIEADHHKQLEQLQQLERLQRLQQLQQLEQLERLQQLEQLERLQQLERLPQLERLERLQQLERLPINFTDLDYRKVKIKKDSVVYCDPPYIGTASYDGDFSHEEFYDWADSQKNPVFISEYNLDDNRFKEIFTLKKRSMLSANKEKSQTKREKVFVNKAGFEAIKNVRR